MATPIKATPTLNHEQSARFLSLVERQLNEPLNAPSPPDLGKAVELAMANGLFDTTFRRCATSTPAPVRR